MKRFLWLCIMVFLFTVSGLFAQEQVAQDSAVQGQAAQEFVYKFPKEMLYKVSIDGSMSFSYQNEKPNKNKIKGNFILRFLNTGTHGDTYNLLISAIRSKIILNDEVIEDITGSDTQVSSVIPKMSIEMDKHGEIIKSTNGLALLNCKPFLNLFPVFPKNLTPGGKWTQTIPSFDSPLAKIPSLQFNYIYAGKINGLDKFNFLSNQMINEEQKEKDIKTKITGLNSSEGEILFDSKEGAIKTAKGALKIDAHFILTIPNPDPQKKEKTIPIPFDLLINLPFSLEHIQ